MKIFELRRTSVDYFQRLFPNMPRFIVQDFIYKNFKDDPRGVVELSDDIKNATWKQETLVITLDVFDPETQKRIVQRKGGSANPLQGPNDAERHATQNALLSSGPSQEPIIVLHTPQGYELIEGWHRTIQSLEKWPKGYKQSSWVGY